MINTTEDKELRARQYAEQYGIINYKIKGNRMIYYENHPAYLSVPAYTIKCTVRLDTMREERKVLKKYYGKTKTNKA